VSRRRQAWYRDGDRPKIRAMDFSGSVFLAAVIALSTSALAFPSGSRSPVKRQPETRTNTRSNRITVASTRTLRFSLAFSACNSASALETRSIPSAVLNSPRSHPAAVERGTSSSGKRSGLPVARISSRTRGS